MLFVFCGGLDLCVGKLSYSTIVKVNGWELWRLRELWLALVCCNLWHSVDWLLYRLTSFVIDWILIFSRRSLLDYLVLQISFQRFRFPAVVALIYCSRSCLFLCLWLWCFFRRRRAIMLDNLHWRLLIVIIFIDLMQPHGATSNIFIRASKSHFAF